MSEIEAKVQELRAVRLPRKSAPSSEDIWREGARRATRVVAVREKVCASKKESGIQAPCYAGPTFRNQLEYEAYMEEQAR